MVTHEEDRNPTDLEENKYLKRPREKRITTKRAKTLSPGLRAFFLQSIGSNMYLVITTQIREI